jgi:hypothetical protein
MARKQNREDVNREVRLVKRKAILAALARVTGEEPARVPGPADDGSNGYYTLTPGEMEALVSGNLEKIENWVSNLDQGQATWLLRRLIKEGP